MELKKHVCVCREYGQDYLDQQEPNSVCSQCSRLQWDKEFTAKFLEQVDLYHYLLENDEKEEEEREKDDDVTKCLNLCSRKNK